MGQLNICRNRKRGIHRETSPCQIIFCDDGIEGMSKIKNPL
nr:MAG TPA: hypothetical protein [Caudoviricetes sp.]